MQLGVSNDKDNYNWGKADVVRKLEELKIEELKIKDMKNDSIQEDLIVKGLKDLIVGEPSEPETNPMEDEGRSQEPTRVTSRYMEEYRRRWKWTKMNDWDDRDEDRMIEISQARPEQIQDYSKKMVLIGTDVVSLYPNLDIEKVVTNVKEAVRLSGTKLEEFDYLEGVRYLALNWSAEECRKQRC